MNIPGLNQWTEIASVYYTGNKYTLSIWVNVEQTDIINNRSLVTTHLDMKKVVDIPDSWESWATTSYQSVWIDSALVASSGSGFDFRNLAVGTPITLVSDSRWISHDDLGNKTITISADHNTTVSLGTQSISGVATLPNIARASSFSLNKTSVEMNGVSTITASISSVSTAFTHKLSFQCGNYVSEFTGVSSSYDFTVPLEWNNAVTSSDRGTATVILTTYNGTLQIGNPVSQTFELVVPSSLVPTISSFTATRNDNNTVPSDWEVYVQGKSKVNLSINLPQGSYGSRITEYSITGAGYYFNTASATTEVINYTGEVVFTAIVKDSRGRQASQTVSIYVYPYAQPVILSETLCYRSNSDNGEDSNGEYVTVVPKITYSTVADKNAINIKVNGTVVSNYQTYTISDVSNDNSYNVSLTISDQFSTISKNYSIPTALVPIDFHSSGTGVAIGKVAETAGLFDINTNTKINGTIQSKSLELIPTEGVTHGGYIDFHYGGENVDYTSRILEYASGRIGLYGDLNVTKKLQYGVTLFEGILLGANSINIDMSDYSVLRVTARIYSVVVQYYLPFKFANTHGVYTSGYMSPGHVSDAQPDGYYTVKTSVSVNKQIFYCDAIGYYLNNAWQNRDNNGSYYVMKIEGIC